MPGANSAGLLTAIASFRIGVHPSVAVELGEHRVIDQAAAVLQHLAHRHARGVLVAAEQVGRRRWEEVHDRRVEPERAFGGERHHRGRHERLRSRGDAIRVRGHQRLAAGRVGEAGTTSARSPSGPRRATAAEWSAGCSTSICSSTAASRSDTRARSIAVTPRFNHRPPRRHTPTRWSMPTRRERSRWIRGSRRARGARGAGAEREPRSASATCAAATMNSTLLAKWLWIAGPDTSTRPAMSFSVPLSKPWSTHEAAERASDHSRTTQRPDPGVNARHPVHRLGGRGVCTRSDGRAASRADYGSFGRLSIVCVPMVLPKFGVCRPRSRPWEMPLICATGTACSMFTILPVLSSV